MKNTILRNFFKMREKHCQLKAVNQPPRYLSCLDLQVNALLLLQVLDHREQVARPGILFRPEHAHEALARFNEDPGQLLKPDRRVDIVTQHRPAGIDVTGKQAFDSFL